MVVPVSTAALIISTTTPDGPTALLNFILEMTFFTIRMVIGIEFKSRLANWILVILKVHPIFPSRHD